MIGIRATLSALLLWSCSAQAFIDPPVITPEHPTTETQVEVSIRNGVCDALLSYSVEIIADAVEVTIRKIPTQDDPLCNYPIIEAVVRLPILPAGTHPLSIYFQDNEPPNALPVLWFQTILDIA